MKKLIFILAALLVTTPALAAVRIIVEPDAEMAAIKYETDGEKVRAFALDIVADAGTIDGISDFIRGESTADNPGYGIFPANFGRYITVDADTGEVTDWDVNDYTPVADPCDPGALGGLGTDGITIEMGALYYPTDDSSPNAPANSGTLCKLTLSEEANLTVTLNEARGGVVLTGGGAGLDGILDVAQSIFTMPVRTGVPGQGLTGLADSIRRPKFASAAGLMLFGVERIRDELGNGRRPTLRALARVGGWLKEFF